MRTLLAISSPLLIPIGPLAFAQGKASSSDRSKDARSIQEAFGRNKMETGSRFSIVT